MLVGRGWGCGGAGRLVESGWRYRPKSQTGSSPLHSSKLQTELQVIAADEEGEGWRRATRDQQKGWTVACTHW